ncbi:Dehydrogenase (flavoprotein) (FixC) (PDB:4OPU) [Commensalibacter communis]|nr:Dehydrogenase (flavoprotein) (FixC) (PDB:4OPU) [Commensalibacter communis]
MKGIDNAQETAFYNHLLKEYLSVFSVCFDNMYENKHNWYYIFIKHMADSAMYFGVVCSFIINNWLHDFDRAHGTWGLVCQIFEAYKEVLVFINKKDLTQYDIPDRLNITGLLFASINSNVLSPRENIDEVIRLLNDNLTIMK